MTSRLCSRRRSHASKPCMAGPSRIPSPSAPTRRRKPLRPQTASAPTFPSASPLPGESICRRNCSTRNTGGCARSSPTKCRTRISQGWIGGLKYFRLPPWFKEGLAVMISEGGGAELVKEDEAWAAIQRGEQIAIDDAQQPANDYRHRLCQGAGEARPLLVSDRAGLSGSRHVRQIPSAVGWTGLRPHAGRDPGRSLPRGRGRRRLPRRRARRSGGNSSARARTESEFVEGLRPHAPVTRQITSPTSSATSSDLSGPSVTPTGRP